MSRLRRSSRVGIIYPAAEQMHWLPIEVSLQSWMSGCDVLFVLGFSSQQPWRILVDHPSMLSLKSSTSATPLEPMSQAIIAKDQQHNDG